jgi:TM2 domain-containing membrane protein YozV
MKNLNWFGMLAVSAFLGWLGIDRFLMGYTWLGILKLLTMGGCGIWWAIDFVLIATEHKFKKVKWVYRA